MADVTTDVKGELRGSMAQAASGIERKLDEKKPQPTEGRVTARIERQTAKAPSLVFLAAAGASLIGSLTLFALRRPVEAIFVGLWPPTFLLLGNYNKIVKLASKLEKRGSY